MRSCSHCGRHNQQAARPHFLGALLLLALAGFFAALALHESAALRGEQKKFAELSERVSTRTPSAESSAADGLGMLPQYTELAEENPELFGWIRIDDTPVNYPVMHTPDNPEKYLRRDFAGKHSMAGTIFLDYRCSADSDNLIVYGHNMKNKTMFGSILNYQDNAYWKEHPIIHFDTLFEQADYEVMAAFYDRIYTTEEPCFKYYDFINAADEAAYEEAICSYREKALYDTGVSAQYGNQLLTLSTCAYHTKNGRFVVVARKMEKTSQDKP